MSDAWEGDDPIWVPLRVVVELHDLAIDRHGGRRGIRSQGLLEQAISRPRRLWFYEGWSNIARAAACYTASIVFIHPFVDGNRRTAWGSARQFVRANGYEMACSQDDAYQVVLAYAASAKGDTEESALTEFMYDHLFPL